MSVIMLVRKIRERRMEYLHNKIYNELMWSSYKSNSFDDIDPKLYNELIIRWKYLFDKHYKI